MERKEVLHGDSLPKPGFSFLKKLSLERGLVIVGAANLLNSLFGGVFWLYAASLVKTVNEYGYLNYLVSIANILKIFILLGLNTTVTTLLAKGREEIVQESNLVVLAAFILLSMVVSLNNWVIILLLTEAFLLMSVAEILGRKSYKEYFLVMAGYRATQIVLGYLFFIYQGALGLLIGYSSAFIFFSYRFISSLKQCSLHLNILKQNFSFTFFTFLSQLSATIVTFLDKVIIPSLFQDVSFGFKVLGFFQLANQFFWLLNVVPLSIFNYLLPEEASGAKKKNIFTVGALTSILLALVNLSLSPIVIKHLFPNFTEAIPLTQLLGFAVVPATIAYVYRAKFFSKLWSLDVLIGNLIFVVAEVGGLYLVRYRLGLMGLGYILLGSQALTALYYTFRGMNKGEI